MAGASDTANQDGGSAGMILIAFLILKNTILEEPNVQTIEEKQFLFLCILRQFRCDSGNLNGHYYKGPYQAMADDGVVWYTWHGWWYSIKSVVMMVRAADRDHPPPANAALPGQLDPSKAAGDAIHVARHQ